MQSPDGDASVEINNFEELLKKNIEKKPPALYLNVIQSNNNIQPKDVLDSVYSQIRTIQLADIRGSKVKENRMTKSTFLSVNRLPVYNEATKPGNFETQCFSNTQLINIIDDAEAHHQGMTQEFERTFLQTPADNKTNTDATTIDTNQLNINTQEFDTTFTQTNIDATISFLNDVIAREENKHYESPNKELADLALAFNPFKTLKELCEQALESKQIVFTSKDMRPCLGNEAVNKTTLNIHSKNKDKEKCDTQKTKIDDSLGDCEYGCSSPVFKSKTKKIIAMANLVVSLEDFEKFEKIALPFIGGRP